MVDVRISGGPCVNLIPDESMGPLSDDRLPRPTHAANGGHSERDSCFVPCAQ